GACRATCTLSGHTVVPWRRPRTPLRRCAVPRSEGRREFGPSPRPRSPGRRAARHRPFGSWQILSRDTVPSRSRAANPGQSRISGAVCRNFGDCTRVCPAGYAAPFVVSPKRLSTPGVTIRVMPFPIHRLRRLRVSESMRSLVRETHLNPAQFVLPLFVCPGEGIKREISSLLVMTDVCNCEYTSHGHCGYVKDGDVDNDTTLQWLAKSALSHARAGADIVAPSDMMDGRVW